MTITRTRARLLGSQIGVCSPRAIANSPSLESVVLASGGGDVYERMEARGLSVDEPVSGLQARQFHIIFRRFDCATV
jgi:hypothetical protein